MADKTGFSMDFSDFDKKFAKIVKKAIPELAAKALFQVGGKVIADAIKKQPRAPQLTGNLWRSQLIMPPKILKDISIEVGFAAEYAARLHEAPSNWNWTLAGSGPKYLEAKLSQYHRNYMKFVADFIAAGAR